MREKSESKLKETMVRLSADHHERLVQSAHAARLPRGVFLAEMFIAGCPPKEAPPPTFKLSVEAQELLKIAHACVSNLSQLHDAAALASEPLSRLAGQDGALMRMSARAREIGMQIKSGTLPEPEAVRLLSAIQAPSNLLNGLARSLNSDQQPALAVWRQTLTALQSVLLPPAPGSDDSTPNPEEGQP